MAKEGKSLKRRLLIPLAAILIIQTSLLGLFYQCGGVADSLEQSAVQMFARDAENNKLNMERELLQRWISGIDDTEGLAKEIETVLRRERCTAADIRSNPDLNREIIHSVMWQLITHLHHSYGNGIFLILDGPASKNGMATEQAGVAIRDMDSNSFAADNSDLLLERGLPSLSSDFGIALDTTWELGFDFTNMADKEFYTVPFARAEDGSINREKLADYAYVGTSDLNPRDNIRVLVYSIPLSLTDGTVIGVIGVEISERSVRKFLNANFQDSDLEIFNLLARLDEEKKSITPVVVGSAQYQRYFGPSEILSFEESGWEGVYTIKDRYGYLWYGMASPLNIYGKRSAFDEGTWACLRLQRETGLFSDVNRVSHILLLSTGVSFLAALAALFFVWDIVMASLKKLLTQLRLTEENEGVRLSNTGISEIDELVGAINRLNENVEKNAAKIAGILELSELEIGLFEDWKDSNTVFCSRSLLKLLDLPCGEALYEFMERDAFDQIIGTLSSPLVEENGIVFEYRGKTRFRYIRMKYILREDGVRSGVLIDVTSEINEKRKMERERNYDFLTGLYNRRAFREKVELMVKNHRENTAAMVVWDLDNLKYVNDTYGHEVGDNYIHLFADCLHMLSEEGAILERRSGDEFSAFLYNGQEQDIWERLQDFMKRMKDVTLTVPGGYQIPLRASAGLAWYPRQASDFDTLVRYADFAMYMAKHSTKGMTQEFELKSYQENFYLLSGQEELNRMLETGDVNFAMQPIVARSGEIYGYELLMRPHLETLRNISELLHLARMQAKLPQIEALTWYSALEWVQEHGKGAAPEARFFINSIANVSLTFDMFTELESRYPQLLERLVVEITEMERTEQHCLKHKIDVVHRWNCKMALDDYGAGYSSEGMLLQFEPDIVKMDLMLVRGIQNDEKQKMIAQNLISYCHPQNILVLAEGVETQEELACLMELGVDLFQGYYLARPSLELPSIDQEVVREMQEYGKAATYYSMYQGRIPFVTNLIK